MHPLIKTWRPSDSMPGVDRAFHNFGDFIGPWLVGKMGYEVEFFSEAAAPAATDALIPVGTMMRNWDQLSRFALTQHFWGTGVVPGRPFNARAADVVIHAVRGPLSALRLKLGPDVPLGDSGLLVSRFLPIPACSGSAVLWASHLQSTSQVTDDFLAAIGSVDILNLMILPEEFEAACEMIRNASIVITSALHPAVVAASYGVPFAFAWPPGVEPEFLGKYQDFCALLKIPFAMVGSEEEAWRWWDAHGSRMVMPDLDGLLAAFPHNLFAK